MKKVLFVLLAIVAMASTSVDAKSISKNPVGCWSYTDESEPVSGIVGIEEDTLVTCYRTDFDSLILCKGGKGLLEYRVTRRYVATTEDGYEKVVVHVEEYNILFNWKYKNGEVLITSAYPDVSCTDVRRTSDNRGTKFPSRYNNNFDKEAADYMIDLLPQLKIEYNPNNGRLYSHGYKSHFRRCKGSPAIPTSKETII